MLTFNDLLQTAGITLDQVRFVRHQDQRALPERSPWHLWRLGNGLLELYQSVQSKEPFEVDRTLASFVVSPLGETIFVGLFQVLGQGVVVDPTLEDPVSGGSVHGLTHYTIERLDVLSEYEGRIVVDWGAGVRTWVQRADKQVKPIIELRRTKFDPPFPGFDRFAHPIRHLDTVPGSWRAALAAVRGVYLLIHTDSGKQYVGSATGEEGFWGRWESYAANGHGGNVGLRLLANAEYQVSILEVAASTDTERDILALEQKWKEKLQSLTFGLNRN